jgi:hypothetical protein
MSWSFTEKERTEKDCPMDGKYNALLDEDSRFDKLVDGALPAAEYKVLLASLEDEPGGWRRCAMAFLEAQAWGREFAAIRRVEEDGLSAKAEEPVALRPVKNASFISASLLLISAACVILAFGLGLATHSRFFSSLNSTRVAGQAPPVTAQQANTAEAPELTAMNLVIDGAGSEGVVVPVIMGKSGAETLVETEPAIPDSVLRSLRLRGHDIQRQQQFIPVPTGDGRHVIFPVEQYHITPVSSRSY